MSKIKFTSGEISKLGDEFYTLILFNKDKAVYKATVERADALSIIEKYSGKIKML